MGYGLGYGVFLGFSAKSIHETDEKSRGALSAREAMRVHKAHVPTLYRSMRTVDSIPIGPLVPVGMEPATVWTMVGTIRPTDPQSLVGIGTIVVCLQVATGPILDRTGPAHPAHAQVTGCLGAVRRGGRNHTIRRWGCHSSRNSIGAEHISFIDYLRGQWRWSPSGDCCCG